MSTSVSISPCVCFSPIPPPISPRISRLDKCVCSGSSHNTLQITRCDRLSPSIRLVPRPNALPNLQLFPPYGNGAPGFVGKSAIVWFQTNDLRLHDHPALMRALETHDTVIPLFIFAEKRIDNDPDTDNVNAMPLGNAKTGQYSASFLLDCVSDLKKSLRKLGSDLLIKKGTDIEKILLQTARALRVSTVFFHTPNYNYSSSVQSFLERLQDAGIDAHMLWAGTLHSLADFCRTDDKSRQAKTFRNFTQFREYVHRNSIKHQQPLDSPVSMPVFPAVTYHHSEQLPKSSPSKSNRRRGRAPMNSIQGGESVALERLSQFLAVSSASSSYNQASLADFSIRIIPWLSSGCISARRLYCEMKRCTTLSKASLHATYLELIWRDFFRFLHHFSSLQSIQRKQQPPITTARI